MPVTENIEKRKICSTCVGEPYLSAEIQKKGRRGKCFYCEETGRCYDLERMSERIEEAFEEHYVRTSDQPSSFEYAMMADKESDYNWEREGEPSEDAIRNAVDLCDAAASDILEVLSDRHADFEAAMCGEETEFSSEVHYTEKATDDSDWRMKWSTLETSLKTETRFFSRSAYKVLESVFNGMEEMQSRGRRPVIVAAGPGTAFPSLFRARCFQSDEDLKAALARPDLHLGPPPSHLARAGRMNAEGISVFYGANAPKVAVAEVRPPVGSRVLVAGFDIVRQIQLLDLAALKEISCHGSIFDPDFASRLERVAFLRNLTALIASPVLPDRERFEYLSTQVIADYLATENSPLLDGIIFPSVQSGGKALNLVLFHKASRVEELVITNGAKISAELGRHYEEGWEEEYHVTEEIPPEEKTVVKENLLYDFGIEPYLGDGPSFPPTLRIDLESIRVHTIEALELKTHDLGVYRFTWDRRIPEEF